MYFVKISHGENSAHYMQPVAEFASVIDAELDGWVECGSVGDTMTLTFEIVEMSQEEYDALPEFTGW